MKPGIETFPRQGAGEVWSQALLAVRPESYLTVQLGIMGCLGTECQALCPVMGLHCEVPPGTTMGASGDEANGKGPATLKSVWVEKGVLHLVRVPHQGKAGRSSHLLPSAYRVCLLNPGAAP